MSTSSHSEESNGRDATSHTLSVQSHEAETICEPSGENATDATLRWFCFFAWNSRKTVDAGARGAASNGAANRTARRAAHLCSTSSSGTTP